MTARAAALAALLLVVAAVWAAPTPAYACSCVAASDAERLAQADVVFTGTLTGEVVDEREQVRLLTFRVDRVYKGAATATQQLTTARSGASCGLEIGGTGPFLVYADTAQPGLTADLCSGTRAGPAPASLGTGQPPQPDGPDNRSGFWIPLIGFVLAASAAGLVGFTLVRRPPR